MKSLQTSKVKTTPTGYTGKYQCDASDKRTIRLPNGEDIATTCLLVDEFDLVAVNLFAFGEEWRFAFAKNSDLQRSRYRGYTEEQRKYLLASLQPATWPPEPPYEAEPWGLMDEIVAQKKTR